MFNSIKTNKRLKNSVTRRAMDKNIASLCSAAAFSVYNSLEQAQIRVNEKAPSLRTVLLSEWERPSSFERSENR